MGNLKPETVPVEIETEPNLRAELERLIYRWVPNVQHGAAQAQLTNILAKWGLK